MLETIYKEKTGKNILGVTMEDINKLISKVSGKSYGNNLVTSRGNIFENSSYNIDEEFNKMVKYIESRVK